MTAKTKAFHTFVRGISVPAWSVSQVLILVFIIHALTKPIIIKKLECATEAIVKPTISQVKAVRNVSIASLPSASEIKLFNPLSPYTPSHVSRPSSIYTRSSPRFWSAPTIERKNTIQPPPYPRNIPGLTYLLTPPKVNVRVDEDAPFRIYESFWLRIVSIYPMVEL